MGIFRGWAERPGFRRFYEDVQVRENAERLAIPWNQHGFDEFGVSKEAIVRWYSPFAQIYRDYLKVSTFGMENVPATGRALLVGNHSGGIGADAAMTLVSTLLNDAAPRLAHGMADYLFQKVPFVAPMMSRIGQLTGLPEHAELLLEADRMLLVFPEGARGTGKLFRDRYNLVRFGTGFMRLALKTRSPVVPFAFVGGEEAFPTVFQLKRLAKMIGAPYIPIAPQLVLWPLPVSCQIVWGEPMHFEGDGYEPDEVIEAYVDDVRNRVEGLIAEGRARRPWAFTTQRVESPGDPTDREGREAPSAGDAQAETDEAGPPSAPPAPSEPRAAE